MIWADVSDEDDELDAFVDAFTKTKQNSEASPVVTEEPKKRERVDVQVTNDGDWKTVIPKAKRERKATAEKKHKIRNCERPCFFRCGRNREGKWLYCSECYEANTGACDVEGCTEPTQLRTDPPGSFHELCALHRPK